jgi:hypothetical protein
VAIAGAFTSVLTNVGSSHSLAPFNVVYRNPTDANPSRICFYDSNAPSLDTVYMTINDSGNFSFTYNIFNSSSNPISTAPVSVPVPRRDAAGDGADQGGSLGSGGTIAGNHWLEKPKSRQHAVPRPGTAEVAATGATKEIFR